MLLRRCTVEVVLLRVRARARDVFEMGIGNLNVELHMHVSPLGGASILKMTILLDIPSASAG